MKDYTPRCWKCWEKLKVTDDAFVCDTCETQEPIAHQWLEYIKKMKAA